jgi:hypothetical protein
MLMEMLQLGQLICYRWCQMLPSDIFSLCLSLLCGKNLEATFLYLIMKWQILS